MTIEVTDEFKHIVNLTDDELFNLLQRTRIDLYCTENDIEGSNERRMNKLRLKMEYIYELLDVRGLDAHKQF